MSGQSRPTSWTFQERRRSVVIDVRPRASVNSFVVLAALAKADLGIARIPDFCVREEVAAKALRPVLDDFLPPGEGGYLHAVYPSARHLSTNVRALLDLIDELTLRGGT